MLTLILYYKIKYEGNTNVDHRNKLLWNVFEKKYLDWHVVSI